MRIRCYTDIRQFPLFVGGLSILWAMVSIVDIDGSLFARQLDYLGIDRTWGWLMALTGLYLVAGSVIKRRDTLTVALFLAGCAWSAMSIVYVDAAIRYEAAMPWITPVTLGLPWGAFTLWLCLAREMLAHPVVIPDRRRVPRE